VTLAPGMMSQDSLLSRKGRVSGALVQKVLLALLNGCRRSHSSASCPPELDREAAGLFLVLVQHPLGVERRRVASSVVRSSSSLNRYAGAVSSQLGKSDTVSSTSGIAGGGHDEGGEPWGLDR